MALEDLVSQQQDAPESPAGEVESVVDESQTTPADTGVDNPQVSGENVDESDDVKDRTKRRIEQLLAERKASEERAARMERELEELRSKIEDNRPKTLRDLDSQSLRRFIEMNSESDDEEMQNHVKEAQFILQEKIIEERLAAEKEALRKEQEQAKIKALEAQLATIVAGDAVSDPESELYKIADTKYRILQAEFGQDVVANNPLAPALAFALAKQEASSPSSLKSRVLNRNERIDNSTRTPSASDDSLESFLKEHKGPLTVSTISRKGTANEAIKRLKTFKM